MARPIPTDAVLVTGGSGFIGRQVVKKLSELGETTVSMYHHRLPDPMSHVYPVCSDLSSSDLLAAPLRGVTSVVHLAWENNFLGIGDELELSLIHEKSRNVAALKKLIAAMEKAGTKRLIFLSANGAARDAATSFLREKYVAEFLVINSKIPEKVILRSSIVCGNSGQQDRFLHSILNVMKFPGFYPVPNFCSSLAPIHILDIAAILAKLVTLPCSSEFALMDVSGNELYKVEELFRMVSERYVKGARLQLRGVLGSSLLPLFERGRKDGSNQPKLRHYLTLGPNRQSAKESPLNAALPKSFHSFKELLAENQSLS